VAWWLGWFGLGVDSELAALQQKRDELFERRETMSDAERRAAFDQFRQQMDGLSDDQRREFFRGGREQFQLAMRERLNEFFTLTAAEQNRALDETIDEMRERRENRDRSAGERRGGRGGPRGGSTDAQREERRKSRLDRSDPQLRARMSEYRRRLDERMAQRGMEPVRGGRGMFGGPGGRRT
jgi:hypothetical protein